MVYMHLGTMSKIGHLSIIFLLIFYFFQNNQLRNYNISDYYKNIELTPDAKRKLRMNKKRIVITKIIFFLLVHLLMIIK